MKFNRFVILAPVMMLGILSGCGKPEEKSPDVVVESDGTTTTTITVAFAECGFGRDFFSKWEEAYNQKNPKEKIKLDLEGDSQMTQNIGTRITTEKNLPDLVMVLSTNWQEWAAKGYLATIDDVYQADSGDGKQTKMIDFIDENLKNFGKVNDNYYAVPWSVGPAGLIYNQSMFEEFGWEVPKTTAELEALCDKINQDTAGTVAPFAWSTSTGEYWSFLTLNWWAQIEGEEGFKEFWKFESPEVFNQQGRLKCLEEFEKLICNHGEAKNSITNQKFMASQMDFINGRAAMIPNGIWFENEMKDNTPAGFKMEMMKTPVIDGAKDSNINVNSSGDFIVIPKKARNIDAAKKFLEFMNTKEGCEIFTKYAGGIRPFNYKPSEIEGLSDFMKSISQMWENETNLYQTSNNPMYYINLLGLWPVYGTPYSRMVQDEDSASQVINSIYQEVSKNWNAYKHEAGLS